MEKVIYIALMIVIMLSSCSKDNVPTYSCTDGVQNGSETGVDCGGDCEECLDITGLWKLVQFDINNQDAISVFNIENIFYDFISDDQLKIAVKTTNHNIEINDRVYDWQDEILIIDGVEYNMEITLNMVKLNYVDDSGSLFDLKLERVISDLCGGVDCNQGICSYGYCVCDTGWQGLDCSEIIMPSKIRITSFNIFGGTQQLWTDKGPPQQTGFYQPSDPRSWADLYIVIKSDDGSVVWTSDVMQNRGCSISKPCDFVLDISLDLTTNYIVEFYDNDIIDGLSLNEQIELALYINMGDLLSEEIASPEHILNMVSSPWEISLNGDCGIFNPSPSYSCSTSMIWTLNGYNFIQ